MSLQISRYVPGPVQYMRSGQSLLLLHSIKHWPPKQAGAPAPGKTFPGLHVETFPSVQGGEQ